MTHLNSRLYDSCSGDTWSYLNLTLSLPHHKWNYNPNPNHDSFSGNVIARVNIEPPSWQTLWLLWFYGTLFMFVHVGSKFHSCFYEEYPFFSQLVIFVFHSKITHELTPTTWTTFISEIVFTKALRNSWEFLDPHMSPVTMTFVYGVGERPQVSSVRTMRLTSAHEVNHTLHMVGVLWCSAEVAMSNKKHHEHTLSFQRKASPCIQEPALKCTCYKMYQKIFLISERDTF